MENEPLSQVPFPSTVPPALTRRKSREGERRKDQRSVREKKEKKRRPRKRSMRSTYQNELETMSIGRAVFVSRAYSLPQAAVEERKRE